MLQIEKKYEIKLLFETVIWKGGWEWDQYTQNNGELTPRDPYGKELDESEFYLRMIDSSEDEKFGRGFSTINLTGGILREILKRTPGDIKGYVDFVSTFGRLGNKSFFFRTLQKKDYKVNRIGGTVDTLRFFHQEFHTIHFVADILYAVNTQDESFLSNIINFDIRADIHECNIFFPSFRPYRWRFLGFHSEVDKQDWRKLKDHKYDLFYTANLHVNRIINHFLKENQVIFQIGVNSDGTQLPALCPQSLAGLAWVELAQWLSKENILIKCANCLHWGKEEEMRFHKNTQSYLHIDRCYEAWVKRYGRELKARKEGRSVRKWTRTHKSESGK